MKEFALVDMDTNIPLGYYETRKEALDLSRIGKTYVAYVPEIRNIPRTIHRIWLDDPMPDAFVTYGEEWRDMHVPRWEVIDWRASDMLPELINQDIFDAAQVIMPKDWKRFQADLLRLELLYWYGGVYVDTDCQPLRPFDKLTLNRQVLIAWSPNRYQGTRILTQAVIGSTPRHPFILDCIREVPRAVENYRNRPLAQMIGPHMIHRVWKTKGWKESGSFKILPSPTFYPQSNRDRDQGKNPDFRQSYCWHRWANSARKRGKPIEGHNPFSS